MLMLEMALRKSSRVWTDLGQPAALFTVVKQKLTRTLLILMQAVGTSLSTISLLHDRIRAPFLVGVHLAHVVVI